MGRRKSGVLTIADQIVQDSITYDIASNGVWEHGKVLKQYLPNEYPLTSGYGQSGGSGELLPKIIEHSVRATCIDGVMIGLHDGATFGLTSYTLSTGTTVMYQLWYGRIVDNKISSYSYVSNSSSFVGMVWKGVDLVLPSSENEGTRFAIVVFKSGSGEKFTNSELAEIQALIKVE